jgi:hypothetical protein
MLLNSSHCCNHQLPQRPKFYHPVTGLSIGVTTFFRKNPATNVYDTAGSIEWLSNTNAIVHFGINEVIHVHC